MVAEPQTPDGPSAAAERIQALDILRGLALFGVLVVNLVGSFRAPFLQHFMLDDPGASGADRLADALIEMLLEGKSLTLFAFLFGAGLAIQRERFARRGPPDPLLRRRLVALLGFGLAHLLLLWNGDILAEYAILGLLALPLMAMPLETLRRWIGRLLLAALVLPFLVTPYLLPDATEVAAEVMRARLVYGSGSYLAIRVYSLEEFLALAPLLATLLPQTLAVILLGVVAWRTGVLACPGDHRRLLLGICAAGIGLGGALTAFNRIAPETTFLSLLLIPSLVVAPIALAMGYAAGLLLLLERPAARRALAPFAPLGRMAFTNYIVQSAVFGWIFFGYGLGLFGRMGTVQALAIGIAVYAAQVAFSMWWLTRYRFGPLEWLWRCLTYGRLQAMARSG